MSNQNAAFPSTFTDEKVKEFVTAFFKESDTKPPAPPAVDAYTTYFSSSPVLKMGSLPECTSIEEIGATRQKMWKGVASRHHIVTKVFVNNDPGTKAEEIVLSGTVEYGLEDGKSNTISWVSRMIFDEKEREEKDRVALKFYQVYL